jgi:putative ABC transport system substrate-binding protein
MRKIYSLAAAVFIILISSCKQNTEKAVPVIGFLDFLQDETLEQARKGFFVALKDQGFSPSDSTIEIIYRNAQNDQPTLLQACDYLISQNVDLIATNPTLSTITAIQRTNTIPVFMMVSPRPDLAGLTDQTGNAPSNLFGVYETLDYIDTSLMLIRTVFPEAVKIGTIYNQSEPQSVDALKRIENTAQSMGMHIEKLSVNSSNETQMVVGALLDKDIDVFFALPDNTVFSSIEIIVKSCDDTGVPVFTCEEGLVKRGALAAFGADMYAWGYQAGMQAAVYLKDRNPKTIRPEIVSHRRKVFNPLKAEMYKVQFDSAFIAVNN